MLSRFLAAHIAVTLLYLASVLISFGVRSFVFFTALDTSQLRVSNVGALTLLSYILFAGLLA